MLSCLMSLPKLPKRPNAGDDMSLRYRRCGWRVAPGMSRLRLGGRVQVSLDDDELEARSLGAVVDNVSAAARRDEV